MIFKLSLELPEEASFVRTTRHLSHTLLEDIHVVKADIVDVETIIAELCSNVIRHAQSRDNHFTVEMKFYKLKVIITVKDKGHGLDKKTIPPVGALRPDGKGGNRIGGFGLALLEGLSDKLDFTMTDPHGTTVRAEKHLRYETQKDAEDAALLDKDSSGSVTISKD